MKSAIVSQPTGREKLSAPFLCFAASLAIIGGSSASAQVGQVQIIVGGAAPLPRSDAKTLLTARSASQQAASVNAWRVLRTRPEFGAKVSNLSAGQDTQMAIALDRRCTVSLVDQIVDKTVKVLNARFRYDCDQLGLQKDVEQIVFANSQVQPSGPAVRNNIAILFLSRRAAEVTRFGDSDVRFSQTTNTLNAAFDSSDADSAASRGRSRTTGRAAETVGFGAGRETVNRNGNSDSRFEAQSKSSSQGTRNAEVTRAQASETKQKTVSRDDEVKYVVDRPDQIEVALNGVFANSGMNLVAYGDIFENCGGASLQDIIGEYAKFTEGQTISPALRRKMFDAARACRISYIGVGVADVGKSDRDPVSGGERSAVTIQTQVWDIREPLPIVIGAVSKTIEATGSSQMVARQNSVSQASALVGQEIITMLGSRGVR